MRVAALDLGSNTSLLLIADVKDGRIGRVIRDESVVTKMGQGVNTARAFHPDALRRMRETLTEYRRLIDENRCDKIVAVATSAARDVKNADELFKIGRDLEIPIHIITGDQEARITFKGAVCDRADHEGLAVIDVGGGSTEIIRSEGGRLIGRSVDVGSVRLTEMFIRSQPIPRDQLNAIRAHVENQFEKAAPEAAGLREVLAVAGTPTTLAAVDQRRDFSDDLVNGYTLSREKIEAWVEKMADMTVEAREKLPGMQPKRADVIVTGSLILLGAMKALGQNQVTVSTRGVRYGVALEWQNF